MQSVTFKRYHFNVYIIIFIVTVFIHKVNASGHCLTNAFNGKIIINDVILENVLSSSSNTLINSLNRKLTINDYLIFFIQFKLLFEDFIVCIVFMNENLLLVINSIKYNLSII